MNKIQRENLLKKMVKKNEIGEEHIPLYRFLLGLFVKGADLYKVAKWTGTPLADAQPWWDNLKKTKYIKKDSNKLHLDEDFWDTGDIAFHLMAGCAEGYIQRRMKK